MIYGPFSCLINVLFGHTFMASFVFFKYSLHFKTHALQWEPIKVAYTNFGKFQLRKILVFEGRNAQFFTVLPFLRLFFIFCFVFGPFYLRKTFEHNYWSRQKIAFRKSASDTLKVTFSQSLTTDRWTDGPTTNLLELLKSAKN